MRTDNMGDLLMSAPAIRALKNSFHCKITLLASPMAAEAANFISEIDEVIIFNAPWNREHTAAAETNRLIDLLRSRFFDASIIFTVYSQNPLAAAMVVFMAGIPRRLAYCRENPYGLLTDWIPDEEPYFNINHQVIRDLELVAAVGAVPQDKGLHLRLPEDAWISVQKKIAGLVDLDKPWIILHPGVSEKKREYPPDKWIAAGKQMVSKFHLQLLLTGTTSEKALVEKIQAGIGPEAYSLAGMLDLGEFIALIGHATLVVSVNTATIHIAAATGCPVIVLYALTNPQHTPWGVPSKVLPFHPPEALQSKNQVVAYVYRMILKNIPDGASPEDIIMALEELLQ
ncbi:MAG TPA: glycosyltransferase family 9 protein [Chitinophagaceae bacterium]|nr:glycosyltransferase family 9 protein [Chitinophagaceae bacterium]